MDKLNLLILILVVILMLNLLFYSIYQLQVSKSDIPVSESVVFKQVEEEEAFEMLESGKLDYYLWSLKPEQAEKAEENNNLKLYFANSQPMGIVLNAAPAKQGLNPFSIREVRFAMNYLIDREKIIDEVYKGYAVPTSLTVAPNHPTSELMQEVLDKYDFKYDKEKAINMINKAMTKAGAKKVNGKWSYHGEILTINIPLSNEYKGNKPHTLKLIGEDLKDAGFDVKPVYFDYENIVKESPVYSTPPSEQKWHISYSGWIYYSTNKYEDMAFMSTYIPKEGWWVHENKEIDRVKGEISKANSEEEWIKLNKELIDLYFTESITMWLVSKQNVYAAQKDVKGLIDDKFIGLRSYMNIRQAYDKDKQLVVAEGMLYEDDENWNPVVIGHISAMDVVNTLHDPATIPDPVTLEQESFRWGYSISRIGQKVPNDAFIWNVEDKEWDNVGLTAEAEAKVVYDLSNYIGTKWHHGEEISWADVLFFLASTWDRQYDEEKQEISSDGLKSYFEVIAGLRIVDDNLEVYLKETDFRDDEILEFADIFKKSAPWEVYAASDKLVFNDYGFQYGEAWDREDLTKLNLANKGQVNYILGFLDNMKYSEVLDQITIGETIYLSETEFNKRKSNLHDWYDEHGHLIIGDGPFYLDRYDHNNGELHMKAFEDYPGLFSKK